MERPNQPRLNAITLLSVADVQRPLYTQLLEGTVNAQTFEAFVQAAIGHGFVQPGSILIWDNARIHTEQHALSDIQAALQRVGATYANLPTYSPELNPCEYVFAEVKCFLRQHARPNWLWRDRVVEAFQAVSHEHVLHYYQHCTRGVLDAIMNE